MNRYLNVFNTYPDLARENNLTRAFVMTLLQEPFLLQRFFMAVTNTKVWGTINIDLQRSRPDKIEIDPSLIVGLTITASAKIPKKKRKAAKKPVVPLPDFFVYTDDTLVVVEVKADGSAADDQVKHQVETIHRSIKEDNPNNNAEIKFQYFAWSDIAVQFIIPHKSLQEGNGQNSFWASHFLDFLWMNYSDWLPISDFSKLPILASGDHTLMTELANRRLNEISKLVTGYTPLDYTDRIGLQLNWKWATETLFKYNGSHLVLEIYPGNTKAQGSQLFSLGNLEWVHVNKLELQGVSYKLEILPHIKFSHVMGRYVTEITPSRKFLANITPEAFKRLSGKWNRSQWTTKCQQLDALLPGLDWKTASGWSPHFESSDRNYIFVSIGFVAAIMLPFDLAQRLDDGDDGSKLANLIKQLLVKFKAIVK